MDFIEQLEGTGLCWYLAHYPSLELDEEAKACGMEPPTDHYHVTIILSYEDEANGWGETPDAAATAALADMDDPTVDGVIPLMPKTH